jgi:hypothetical protein
MFSLLLRQNNFLHAYAWGFACLKVRRGPPEPKHPGKAIAGQLMDKKGGSRGVKLSCKPPPRPKPL